MSFSVSESFSQSAPATVCQHLSRLLQSHVYYLLPNHSARYSFAFGSPSHPDDSVFFRALFGDEWITGRPVIKATRPGEAYIAVDLFKNDRFFGRLAAGPITSNHNTFHEKGLLDYTISAAILLYHFVYEDWTNESELRRAVIAETVPGQEETGNKPQAEPMRPHHHSIAYENQLYSLISQGNGKRLMEMIQAPPDGAYGLLDKKHPLRNLKNDCICILTLAARAAIAGGLDSETAFSLSDEAIQNVELVENVESLYRLIEQKLCRFSKLVEKIRHYQYSYRINYCRNYIINTIYEKQSVCNIAAHFSVSPEYLSDQFKKETGESLKNFIESTRCWEAKRLLSCTNKSILEIASSLHFHDQSHFTKSFKKNTGFTPGAFRKRNDTL